LQIFKRIKLSNLIDLKEFTGFHKKALVIFNKFYNKTVSSALESKSTIVKKVPFFNFTFLIYIFRQPKNSDNTTTMNSRLARGYSEFKRSYLSEHIDKDIYSTRSHQNTIELNNNIVSSNYFSEVISFIRENFNDTLLNLSFM